MIRTVFVFLFLFTAFNLSGQTLQTLRGQVVEDVLRKPVPYASIRLSNSQFSFSIAADSLGYFVINDVAMGRYDIECSSTGYYFYLLKDVLVSAAKETLIEIVLKQEFKLLAEVTLSLDSVKRVSLSPDLNSSTKMFNTDQAKRYAGAMDDPARLVASFAGVSSNVSNNALMVRGNNPQSLQWRLEGVELPSPNHLNEMRAFGGGTVSALSAQVLGNSTFISGAMPAAYHNALSGVLDISLRKGNNLKHEQTFQLGLIGIDLAGEGPFKKGKQSSYLFNYRYSTLALVAPLLAEDAGGIRYQDLSFKLNFPTRNAGEISVWGMGLTDRISAEAKFDIRQWTYDDDREQHKVSQYTGIVGASHRVHLGQKRVLSSTFAAMFNGIAYPVNQLDSNFNLRQKSILKNDSYHLTFTTALSSRFSKGHANQTGLTVTHMNYDLLVQDEFTLSSRMQYLARAKGVSNLIAAYSSSTVRLAENLTWVLGLNGQWYTLNHDFLIALRSSIRYRLSAKHSLQLAYGLHSRLERLSYYFINDQTGQPVNKNLKATKAHHLVLGYDITLSEKTHLKFEPYYQFLFDIPVIKGSSFSLLNQQGDWFLNAPLQSTGLGRNMGVDLTFESSLASGFYLMGTASLLRSTYKADDQIWRNTRYNRNYAFNLMLAKEWYLGKTGRNVLGLSTRFNFQGGDRYSPIDAVLSKASRAVVFDSANAFSLQFPSVATAHFNLSYKVNRNKTAQEIALKVLNVTNYQEYVGFRYNYQTTGIDLHREPAVIPNLSYRIDF